MESGDPKNGGKQVTVNERIKGEKRLYNMEKRRRKTSMLDDELGEKKKSPGEKAKKVRIVWRETEWRKQVFGLSDPQPYLQNCILS